MVVCESRIGRPQILLRIQRVAGFQFHEIREFQRRLPESEAQGIKIMEVFMCVAGKIEGFLLKAQSIRNVIASNLASKKTNLPE